VREFELIAHRDNLFTVRVRLSTPALLPAIQVRLAIARQPSLPASPHLVLELMSQGVASVAVRMLRFADLLPPGVRFDGHHLFINIETFLRHQGAAAAFPYLTELTVDTADRVVILHVRAELPPPDLARA
jgi:hypothetical protein